MRRESKGGLPERSGEALSPGSQNAPSFARLTHRMIWKRWVVERLVTFVLGMAALPVLAQTPAMPRVHDPSTIIRDEGAYYVYGTGRGIPILSSPDGVNWARIGNVFTQIPETVHAAVPKNDGVDVWAPDIVRVGGQFYLYYAVSSWGSFVSAVALATSPTLNPKDPAYHWTDRGVVVRSDGVEDLNAIDPGVILAPDGTMWICYGSYHGTIQMIQLDPKTGLRISAKSPVSIVASASEAADIIFRDGYYYLFVNHGSCCQGKNSGYNIRVGRSKTVTGPYVDRRGDALTKAPGTLFLAAHDHRIGPGHFGRIVEDGAERFSLHYEADLTDDGRSTLGLRPLLWSVDGWPVAGDTLGAGTYQILSRQSEDTLELRAAGAATLKQVRLTRYLTLENQKWTIAPGAGGCYRILNKATSEALEVSGPGLVEAAGITGADAQLWHLDQMPDGAYRIRNKGSGLSLALQGMAVVAEPFRLDDFHTWTITTP